MRSKEREQIKLSIIEAVKNPDNISFDFFKDAANLYLMAEPQGLFRVGFLSLVHELLREIDLDINVPAVNQMLEDVIREKIILSAANQKILEIKKTLELGLSKLVEKTGNQNRGSLAAAMRLSIDRMPIHALFTYFQDNPHADTSTKEVQTIVDNALKEYTGEDAEARKVVAELRMPLLRIVFRLYKQNWEGESLSLDDKASIIEVALTTAALML